MPEVEDKKFRVTMEVLYSVEQDVDAPNLEEAIKFAKENFEEMGIGELDLEFVDYEHEYGYEVKEE